MSFCIEINRTHTHHISHTLAVDVPVTAFKRARRKAARDAVNEHAVAVREERAIYAE